MDYRLAWQTLKQMIECRETHLRDKSKTDKKRTEDLTKGELCGISIIQQFMFDIEADAGLYTFKSEVEVRAHLWESVRRSVENLPKEELVKFVSQLSMYDKDGKLVMPDRINQVMLTYPID